MIRRPPRSTRTDTLFPYTTLFRSVSVAIDVTLHAMPVFYCALPGTTADNASWVRRKRAVTLRFFRSSYAVGRVLAQQNMTIEAKYGLSSADYATHGGSFPILVEGTGCVGAVTVSGMPPRAAHNKSTKRRGG